MLVEYPPVSSFAAVSKTRPTWPLVLFGILFPILAMYIAVIIELNPVFDPTAMPFHALLVASVPVCALIACLRPAGFAIGFALAISIYYTIVTAPLILMGLVLAVMLIGVIPLTPLCCLIQFWSLLANRKLYFEARRGALAACLLLLASDLPGLLALRQMNSHDVPVLLFSIPGMGAGLRRACAGGTVTPLNFWLLRSFGGDACPEVYRATGELPPPRQTRWRTNIDPDLGSDRVGVVQAGLLLVSSAMKADRVPSVGGESVNWTLEFRNDSDQQQEARMRVALPTGGVVHGATLWVNGVEREAVFGAKEKVTAAYQKVAVVRQRDPLLVTWSGRDEVFVQCFPIPPKGSMRIRLAFTAPVEGETVLPAIIASNFPVIAPEVQANLAINTQRLPAFDPQDRHYMFQAESVSEKPRRVIVVFDDSAWMKPHKTEIAQAVRRWSEQAEVETIPRLKEAAFAGGADNAPGLSEAFGRAKRGDWIVWIHGRQPLELHSLIGSPLSGVKLLSYRMEEGENVLLRLLPDARRFHKPLALDNLIIAASTELQWKRIPAIQAIDNPIPSRLWAGQQDLGADYRVVTKSTGAVVLETDQQYKENGLDGPAVAQTPEPGTWFLMACGLAAIGVRFHVGRKCSSKNA